MSEKVKINWNRLCQGTSYVDVKIRNSGLIPTVPTMYSPDGSQIYLSSIDLAHSIDDIKSLCRAFEEIFENLQSEIAHLSWSIKRAAELEQDYLVVWNLLQNLNALPDDYEYPEFYLEKIWNEFRPVKPIGLDIIQNRSL